MMGPGVRRFPWWTSDSVAWLDRFLNKDSKVLEFGIGRSTLWLSDRVGNLVSVDDNEEWVESVKKEVDGVDLRLIERPYDVVCSEFRDAFFDAVVIDGRDRVQCARSSKRLIRAGGALVLDNADRSYYGAVKSEILSDWTYIHTRGNDGSEEHVKKGTNWDTDIWVNEGGISSV